MNLTRLAIIFALITIPFSVITYVTTLAIQQEEQIEVQYRTVINNAVKDGTVMVKLSAEGVSGTGGSKAISINPEEVVEAFLASYHYGFNAKSITDRVRLNQYVMAILVLDYDGFFIYGTREVQEPSGSRVLKHVLSEKKPYLYEEGDYVVKVNLGDHVSVLNTSVWTEELGPIDDILDLPPEIDPLDYDDFRQRVIKDSLEAALAEGVNGHNRYADQLGVTYDFYLPLGDGSALSKSVKDVGMMVFVQGYPMGGGRYLDMSSFATGNILARKVIPGYQDGSGDLYYCEGGHSHSITDTQVRTFGSPEEAASEGYWPCHLLGK